MNEEVHNDVQARIKELVEKEKNLRLEIKAARDEMARLKSDLQFNDLSKPKWLSDLPEEFWCPAYYAFKTMNALKPSADYNNISPDLSDWSKGSGIKEFIINLLIGIGFALAALQLFFFLL